jgi:hypothetical protein
MTRAADGGIVSPGAEDVREEAAGSFGGTNSHGHGGERSRSRDNGSNDSTNSPAGRSGEGSSGDGGSNGGFPASRGGTAGTASVRPGCPSTPLALPLLIDDLESGSGTFNGGKPVRNGSWYAYNDRSVTGTQSPVSIAGEALPPDDAKPPACTGRKAAHTHGRGFAMYAALGADLANVPTKSSYDASAYSGVSFWAKGRGAVRFMISSKNTDPIGNVCLQGCNDHFGIDIGQLSNRWVFYTILFAKLSQSGFGTIETWDPHNIYGTLWQVDPAREFDLWVDDVAFVP